MTLLGQQELLTPAPRRRLIVPAGCDSHWGVDTSVSRIAVGWVRDGERGVVQIPLPRLDGGARLAHAYEVIQGEIRDLVSSRVLPWPGLVWVEQAVGDPPNLQLIYMLGVVQGAIHSGVALSGAPVVRVETVPASRWKLLACGKGNLYKPTKKKLGRVPLFEDYGVAVWARQNGYTGDSWDCADAYGIAEASRREVLLEVR